MLIKVFQRHMCKVYCRGLSGIDTKNKAEQSIAFDITFLRVE